MRHEQLLSDAWPVSCTWAIGVLLLLLNRRHIAFVKYLVRWYMTRDGVAFQMPDIMYADPFTDLSALEAHRRLEKLLDARCAVCLQVGFNRICFLLPMR